MALRSPMLISDQHRDPWAFNTIRMAEETVGLVEGSGWERGVAIRRR